MILRPVSLGLYGVSSVLKLADTCGEPFAGGLHLHTHGWSPPAVTLASLFIFKSLRQVFLDREQLVSSCDVEHVVRDGWV